MHVRGRAGAAHSRRLQAGHPATRCTRRDRSGVPRVLPGVRAALRGKDISALRRDYAPAARAQRFERRGFKVIGFKMLWPTTELAAAHYEEHRERHFFGRACGFLTSGPVVASVWEARGVVAAVCGMVGGTEPLDCPPGTIRGDYGVHWRRNLIHSSSDPESAAREIALWFEPAELVPWEQATSPWLYELPPQGR